MELELRAESVEAILQVVEGEMVDLKEQIRNLLNSNILNPTADNAATLRRAPPVILIPGFITSFALHRIYAPTPEATDD